LAIRSGQSFLELLQWHDRDVDTLTEIYQEQDTDARMAAARAKYQQQNGG
jgi:hypothetical protein